MSVIDKKDMSEEDIKLHFVTPAIMNKGWSDSLTMEARLTDGAVIIKGNSVSRGSPKKADYVLYMNKSREQPIAVVEAENNRHGVSYGMQQCKEYCEKLNAPFAYSSNGDAFDEFDFLTGREREIGLDEFPAHDELYARYKTELNGGSGMTESQERAVAQPYFRSASGKAPRYYQTGAINKVLEAIAGGQKRILLVMATGTGKTYVAFQIVYRLLNAGLRKKILYLSDRNFLADQAIQQDFAPLEKVIHKINFAKEDKAKLDSYQVYFALYQQLTAQGDAEGESEDGDEIVDQYKKFFAPDYFDLIIVDECHRGSAKKDSNWRAVLEYFSSATQIGMTATPKETVDVSNIDYFGEPVYTYKLKEGIDDGFLAPYKVINLQTNIGDGWRPTKGQLDYYGNEIEDRIYNNRDYDYNIIIQDRIRAVAEEITNFLKSFDRMAKTIVFCPTEAAAERMRRELTNLNSDMCAKNGNYVVRITGGDEYGKSQLDYFLSVSSEYPVIATTSKLLSTGADCKMVKLIVLDEWIESMTEFKQIIGRGTRLRYDEGKTHFYVMDFRGVTRLFSDSDWDGPIEQDDGFSGGLAKGVKSEGSARDGAGEPKPIIYVTADGCPVTIVQKIVSVYDTDGKLLRQENIVDYTKSDILGDYASLEEFIKTWTAEEKKRVIRERFEERGIDLEAMKVDENLSDVDDFDFICHLAYDRKPLTRRERAENVRKKDIFSKYGDDAREVLNLLLDKYADEGIYEIENTKVLELEPFKKFGTPSRIANLFGGKEGYLNAVRELETEIYEAA